LEIFYYVEIFNDESKFTPIYEDYKTDKNILKRQSRDTKIPKRKRAS
jgi:hypothetical protein